MQLNRYTYRINFLIQKRLIPFLSVFLCGPAQVLFLNNAVNHGIISPIAYAQAAETGKSLMFLLDSNCGPLLGTLCSIALLEKEKPKKRHRWQCLSQELPESERYISVCPGKSDNDFCYNGRSCDISLSAGCAWRRAGRNAIARKSD